MHSPCFSRTLALLLPHNPPRNPAHPQRISHTIIDMSISSQLFQPTNVGALHLNNRIAMAPLTRSRAGADGVPSELHVEYYQQRAGAGLIVTEGAYTSPAGHCFLGQPGIVTEEHIAGWRNVADAVHTAGGTIAMQIMHGGRLTLENINNGIGGTAPSAIAPGVTLHGAEGRVEVPTPRALDEAEIPTIIAEFVQAATNAIEAGMDAVEIHSANGYLLHQFLCASANHRTDSYGGSPENRARLVIEIVRSVAAAIGAERTAIRISPEHNVQGALEEDRADVIATYGALLAGIADLPLAYISLLHGDLEGEVAEFVRNTWPGTLMLNSGFATKTTLDDVLHIAEHSARSQDIIAVGRLFISNPDLVRRWQEGLDITPPDSKTFYTPGPTGYIDYPFAN